MKIPWLLTTALLCGLAQAARADETILNVPPFGPVHLYAASPQPFNVVLSISGDGGCNEAVVDRARTVAANDALVAGVDLVP